MTEAAEQAADALGAVIEARDTAGLQSLYAEDIAIWHGVTNVEQSKAENIALLDQVFRITSRLRYADIRRFRIEDGIVQQHSLVGAFADGTPTPDLHACLVLKLRGDQIVRIDEYFDSAAFAPFAERIAALSQVDA
ncbi:nuclear transport factor 2 family protein [Sphingomonas sp. ID0503]|uniref:nuclear transport factor 2 family protein n=1 Tax=Sphingomonas sp. ID0503 TaxID=3399691 RepID=UPI003AFACA09